MNKIIEGLTQLHWGYEQNGDRVFINGYWIEEINGSYLVTDVWNDCQEKWYKRVKPLLNLVTDR